MRTSVLPNNTIPPVKVCIENKASPWRSTESSDSAPSRKRASISWESLSFSSVWLLNTMRPFSSSSSHAKLGSASDRMSVRNETGCCTSTRP